MYGDHRFSRWAVALAVEMGQSRVIVNIDQNWFCPNQQNSLSRAKNLERDDDFIMGLMSKALGRGRGHRRGR
ncbi:MAG: hypothetical protein R2865_13225 [Deinococcales bacterium]